MPIWSFSNEEIQDARSEARAQQRQAQQPMSFPDVLGSAVSGGLELLGRPARGVAGAAEAALTGRDPFQAFMTGLGGGGPENFAAVLERQGVGTLPVGPLDTRGIAGFGLDLLLDPLNLVPRFGPPAAIGRSLGRVRTVAPHALGALPFERGGRALETLYGPVGETMPPGPRRLPGVGRLIEETNQPSALRTGVERLAEVPGVGAAVRRGVRPFVPRALPGDHIEQANRTFELMRDMGRRAVQVDLAPLKTRRFSLPIDENGDIVFRDGTRIPWDDVFRNPAIYKDELGLSPNDLDFIHRYQLLYAEPRALYEDLQRQLDAVSEDAGKRFKVEDINLQPGEEFVSRIAIKDGNIVHTRPVPRVPGRKRGFQHERIPIPTAAMRERGVTFVTDPMEVAELRLSEVYDKIAEMSWALEVAKDARYIKSTAGTAGALAMRKSLADERVELMDLNRLLARASRGEPVPAGSWERHREHFASWVDEAQRVQSHTVRAGGPIDTGRRRTEPGAPFTAVSLGTLPGEKFATETGSLPAGGINLGRPGIESFRTMPNTTRLRLLQGEVQSRLDANRTQLADLGKLIKEGTSAEEQFIDDLGLKAVDVPATAGMWFEPAAAERIGSHLAARPPAAIAGVEQVSGLARGLQAGFDLGGQFIQGLPMLIADPVAWFRGARMGPVEMWRALANQPRKLDEYLARPENQQFLRAHPGLMVNSQFQYQTLERGNLGERLGQAIGERLPPGVGERLGRIPQGFQNLYEGPLTIMRLEMGKALANTPRFKDNPRELEDFVNHTTGVLSARGMGIGPSQRALESILFFSSQYLRASLALVGDLFRPATRDEAANTLGSMLAVGAMAYNHIARAMDQEPVYDPNDARFFTVQIGDKRVGFGSNWIALARLLGQAIESPGEFANVEDLPANPLVKFLRARTSPAGGFVSDLVTGETYGGQPISGPGEAALRLGERFVPFGLAAGIEGGPGEAAASALGLRAFPTGYRDISRQVAEEMFGPGTEVEDLGPIERQRVLADPRVTGLEPPPGARFAGTRELRAIQGDYAEQLEQRAAQVERGQITRGQFREAVAAARLERDVRFRQLPARERKAQGKAQEDRDQYFALLRTKDEFGRTDFETADAFFTALPRASQIEIRDTEEASLERLGPKAQALMREMWAMRQQLEPYWEARKTALERSGIWDQWVAATPRDRLEIEQTNKYKIAKKYWDRARERLRLRTPEIDRLLVDWGYVTTPIRQQRR